MRFLLFLIFAFWTGIAGAQLISGSIRGTATDGQAGALAGATALLMTLPDSGRAQRVVADETGSFVFPDLPAGLFRLRLSYSGRLSLLIDSIRISSERPEVSLGELVLAPSGRDTLETVVIYAEKPLLQSKDGNLTFNAAESPLSAGANAGELLTHVPLISKDADGRVLVRGKAPRILIDDKPVELSQQQLQDFLESLPGSSIEKIEVLTNPPPQYAGESGGVINIVTRKGSVGRTARISASGGTRGEAGANGTYTYRRKGLNYSLGGSLNYSRYGSNSWSRRSNVYPDSTNYFNTDSRAENGSWRPAFRGALDYQLRPKGSASLSLNWNPRFDDNRSGTGYSNLNRFGSATAFSQRTVVAKNRTGNGNLNLSYSVKTKRAGESARWQSTVNWSDYNNDRTFNEQAFDPESFAMLRDSQQVQAQVTHTFGYSNRLTYDRTFPGKRTTLSLGAFQQYTVSVVDAEAAYLSAGDWKELEALTNSIRYRQQLYSFRASGKQQLGAGWNATGGLSAEATLIRFDRAAKARDTTNRYWSFLPFLTLNRTWKEQFSLTVSYKRSIRRPGFNELNPTVEIPDRYTRRYGNPGLLPALTDNFDLVLGYTRQQLFLNLGLGFNNVRNLFNRVRDSVDVTWQNIGARKEYELSTWNGFPLGSKVKVNLSASYTFNVYDAYQRAVRGFRNGGSFTSNATGTCTFSSRFSGTWAFTYNRLASPQGVTGSSLGSNLGLQARWMRKRLTTTLNIIDPWWSQISRNTTSGLGSKYSFIIDSRNESRTSNLRLTVSYNLIKASAAKKTGSSADRNKAS